MAELTRTTPMRLITLLAVLAIVVAGCGDTGRQRVAGAGFERCGPERV